MESPSGSRPARRDALGPERGAPRRATRRWVALGAVVGGLLLGGCQLPAFGAYRGATTQGQDAFKLWQGFFIAGIVVFAIVFFLIIWAVFRYRRRSDDMPKQTQYHTFFEIVYTVVPIITVLVMFVFIFVTENEVDALNPQSVTVNVTAFQWGWQFQYPGYDVRVLGVELQDPTMVIPAHETVKIYLRSADVMHGFYVPQFNFSRYALPGVTNQFDLNAVHTGTFRGQCTNLCGLYHSLMIFQVKAVTPSQFQAWIHQQQNAPNTSDSIAAAKRQIARGNLK
ncbi:MAG: cytochrome c oxidase subunit II [Acidimicrobiales bacterium]